ncbi:MULTISPECIES: winged helix-turn-helix transcriptional regulator [unclassified Solwaraspora]|uniref:winged helix-turn-helix transcriptional regulator n=1 Tax=unclassified Solwaraspora TaxID=2627926 RepID=UPI00259B4850|nr:winged helix-turn-helix transcriptional regulator [Solwaraspora sp. WMMA2056]WJK42796.1 winged helix-turn-helix transcriptional regulator [Solwaraspora sp. WMMA2056]
MQADAGVLLAAVGRLRGRWTLHIVHALLDGPAGFNDLRRAVPAVGPSTLARRLGELEAAGIVSRTVIDTTPPGTRYALTATGIGLRPVLAELAAWAGDTSDPDVRDRQLDGLLALMQERWMLELHCALLVGPRRFTDLARDTGVNQVTLTQRLADLEQRGLIQRLADGSYAFSAAGEGFHRVGEALADWAAATSGTAADRQVRAPGPGS